MSNAVMNQTWPLVMPLVAKGVMISLADQADESGICWPSLQNISDRTCASKRAVINAIAWLERNNALIADRSNGRHTKYRLTPDRFLAERVLVRQSEKATSAPDAPVPVHEVHQCSSSTSAPDAPTSAPDAPVPVHEVHQPVHEVHTNPHEPPVEPSITPKARAKRSGSELPDGFAEFWAEYPKKEAKLTASASWLKKRLHEDLPLRERVMAALAEHRLRPQWTKDGGTYVPNPATWLNKERWTDELGSGATAVLGHPVGSDAYLLANRDAPWWRDAGFENVWEASNARCWHTNAKKFRDGRLVPDDVEEPA